MRLAIWRKGKGDGVIDTEYVEIPGDYTDVLGTRHVKFPHCDALILHSPGTCRFCDLYPDRQALRSAQGIAFTDMAEEARVANNLLPCPSTYRRPPEVRDLWRGNVQDPPPPPHQPYA